MHLARIVLIFAITCASSQAEEINIGHLETNDDTGINWLFFNCDKSSNGSRMQCDITQTLIFKKKTQSQADNELKEQIKLGALNEFNKELGSGCKTLTENIDKLDNLQKSGLGVDGHPVSRRLINTYISSVKSIIDVCKYPTEDNARRFFSNMENQEVHTCNVHQSKSLDIFNYNYETNSWVSQSGPNGVCGTITIGSLVQDSKNHFWSYVEKTIRTNSEGILPTGQSCKLFPEHTLNYSWHTIASLEDCQYMESLPD